MQQGNALKVYDFDYFPGAVKLMFNPPDTCKRAYLGQGKVRHAGFFKTGKCIARPFDNFGGYNFSVSKNPRPSRAYPILDGIPARKAAKAEEKEFLKRTTCENRWLLSIFATAKGLPFWCSSHLSAKRLGDKTSRSTGPAKNVIFDDSKC